jgi:RNA polymerase sigma-70 factor, ECF subfamily
MDDFEAHRDHLRAVAHRLLGSRAEADDAVQEAWLRLARSDADRIDNVRGWLTTVVARVCLDMLRSRTARREVPLAATPAADVPDPEQEAVLADSVGAALLVVLDTLSPAERLAFVLHDLFAVPFADIATILGRSVPATKMLASRARHRVRAANAPDGAAPDGDLARQRPIVAAFLAAARDGDFTALLAVLDPDVTVRAGTARVRGARAVAGRALTFARHARDARLGLADGVPAILVAPHGRLATVLTFTIPADRITAVEIVTDPQRLAGIRVG